MSVEGVPLKLGRRTLVARASGALWWAEERLLAFADLHLEKGSSYAAHGALLPPYDTRDALLRMTAEIDRLDPAAIVCLGDSFHDQSAGDRMSVRDRETLAILQEDRKWFWLSGNHDPKIAPCFGGRVLSEITLSGITFRHEPSASPVTHEIAAHLHPAARVSFHGHVIRRPCFVANGNRLVMPAFGTYAGGLNVLDDAFSPLFGNDGLSVLVMGQEGLYPIAARLLKED